MKSCRPEATAIGDDPSAGRNLAGRLENDPPGDLHCVVCESFVIAAQQGRVHRGGCTVRPLSVHQHGEQVPVEVVHRIVGVSDVTGPTEVT